MDSFTFHDEKVICDKSAERCKGCKHSVLHDRHIGCVGTTCHNFIETTGRAVLEALCIEPKIGDLS